MASGYYKDKSGNCMGYWQASEVPENTDTLTYVESDTLPDLYFPPEPAPTPSPAPTKEQLLAQLNAIAAQIAALPA